MSKYLFMALLAVECLVVIKRVFSLLHGTYPVKTETTVADEVIGLGLDVSIVLVIAWIFTDPQGAAGWILKNFSR